MKKTFIIIIACAAMLCGCKADSSVAEESSKPEQTSSASVQDTSSTAQTQTEKTEKQTQQQETRDSSLAQVELPIYPVE